MISDSSNDTSSTALPASRWATMYLCTYSIAPTSRPRVGLTQIKSGLSLVISRAIITFCWLPPERLLAGRPALVRGRTSNFSMRALACSVMYDLRKKPRRENSASPTFCSTRFSATTKSSTSPYLWRSSGMDDTPLSKIILGALLKMSLPLMVTLPDSAFARPVSAITNSLWPLPSTPAMPTISPALTSSDRPSTALCPM